MANIGGRAGLRPASAEDAAAITWLQVRAWQTAFQDVLPSEYLQSLSVASQLPRTRRLLADATRASWVHEDGGHIDGFLQYFIESTSQGCIFALYVDPSTWRQGIGRVLLKHGEDALSQAGTTCAYLWTARDSVQARRFYEDCGWTNTGEETVQQLEVGVDMLEVKYNKGLRVPS